MPLHLEDMHDSKHEGSREKDLKTCLQIITDESSKIARVLNNKQNDFSLWICTTAIKKKFAKPASMFSKMITDEAHR